jgi:DinB superfamily
MTGWAGLRSELEDARRRAHAIADPLSDRAWTAVPAPREWSASECVVHLNLGSRAFLPLLHEAVAQAPKTSAHPGSMGLTGILLWCAITLRLPVRTTEPFVPPGPAPRPVVLGEFDTLQDQLLAIVADAEGRDLRGIKITSPFDARLRYGVYAALRIVAAHQRLHLRQAATAARTAEGG